MHRRMNTTAAVKDRYAAGAKTREAALCCPVSYDARYLEAIPAEVIEKDYGCGDPSRHVRAGETVLDLGSGTGKICFIASQVVGPKGRVIGVDLTDAMLEVARRNAPLVAARVGWANVEFRKGRIQDLGLDLEAMDAELAAHPAVDGNSFVRALETAAELRARRPLVSDASVDVVVSNCVLNLVATADRRQMFEEIHRVLRPGGRAVISDIVCDRAVPEAMQQDATLWSGCLSGAFEEGAFLHAWEAAGFAVLKVLVRQKEPWQVVEGIEFRSLTVEVTKATDQAGAVAAQWRAAGCCEPGCC